MPDFTSFDDKGLDHFIASQHGGEPQCQAAMAERQSRQLRKSDQQAQERHAESERLSDGRHQKIMDAHQELKDSVDQVHRIDVWILVVGIVAAFAGIVAAIAAVILLLRA